MLLWCLFPGVWMEIGWFGNAVIVQHLNLEYVLNYIGWYHGLSPVRRQAMILTNVNGVINALGATSY